MRIAEEVKNGKKYYYIEHSYRKEGKIIKPRKYLGKKIPDNIEILKKEFMNDTNEKRWYSKLKTIKNNFSKEFNQFPKSAKEKYYRNFMIKFTYNTNKIEGSTLTLKETSRIIEDQLAPKNKPIKDIREVERHTIVYKAMLKEKRDLSHKLVLKWHKDLFTEIDNEISGNLRKHPVGIAGSKFEPPQANELDYLLRRFFLWYNNKKTKTNPVELAALAHLKFVTIHPFSDGNGRISRLIMNFVLYKNHYPMLDIEYSKRDNYYTALERSQIIENEEIFVQYLIRKYLKTYEKYIIV